MTSIDEQIAFIDRRIHAGTDAEFYRGIRASLERIKSLDAQPVPVEPKFREFRGCLKPVDRGMWVNGPSNFYSASEVDAAIETLQSALQRAQDERDNEKEVRNCISRAHEAEQKRAEKAEALAEQNRKDAERYRFAKDIFAGDDSAETNAKVLGITAGLVAGMDVDTAIDQARAE